MDKGNTSYLAGLALGVAGQSKDIPNAICTCYLPIGHLLTHMNDEQSNCFTPFQCLCISLFMVLALNIINIHGRTEYSEAS